MVNTRRETHFSGRTPTPSTFVCYFCGLHVKVTITE